MSEVVGSYQTHSVDTFADPDVPPAVVTRPLLCGARRPSVRSVRRSAGFARPSVRAAHPPGSAGPVATHATYVGESSVPGVGTGLGGDLAVPPPTCAGEHPGTYDALERAAAAVAEADLDAMDEPSLRRHLDHIARPIAQLEAARSRCMAAVEARRVAAAPPERRATAGREARAEMARQQRLTPSNAKRAADAGRAARAHPALGQAFRAGDLSDAHVQTIAGVLDQLTPDRVAVVEPVLLELAATRDAVAFGREARRVLAEEDIACAARLEKRRHGQRRLRMTDTDDGGLVFSGEAHGLAAETARVALRAFRRPDSPGEHRRPEHRDADAFEEVCSAALRSLDAPSEHGTRPQVLVIVQADQLGRPIGTARFGLSGQPVTTAELGPVLADCAIGRLIVDAKGTPLEASEMVRTVPAGLWRALVVRDGGCTWDGCDALAAWCDVAHGEASFADRGRLSPENAMLLCRRHHRRFDHGDYRVDIDGDRVTYHRGQRSGEPEPTSVADHGSPNASDPPTVSDPPVVVDPSAETDPLFVSDPPSGSDQPSGRVTTEPVPRAAGPPVGSPDPDAGQGDSAERGEPGNLRLPLPPESC